ncbi:hypothetical protein, partial [Actinophytocola sp.]|uniref:hypothetical protein n=1 Tax=Actinophytocola sp. TaxID=1872138 RepID=UPI0025C54837
ASAAVAVAGAVAGRADDPTWYREVTAVPPVRLVLDPALDAYFPRHWAAAVEVGDRPARLVVVAPGDHEAPLSDAEVRAKAARLLPAPRPLLDRVLAVAAEPDVATLREELCRVAG